MSAVNAGALVYQVRHAYVSMTSSIALVGLYTRRGVEDARWRALILELGAAHAACLRALRLVLLHMEPPATAAEAAAALEDVTIRMLARLQEGDPEATGFAASSALSAAVSALQQTRALYFVAAKVLLHADAEVLGMVAGLRWISRREAAMVQSHAVPAAIQSLEGGESGAGAVVVDVRRPDSVAVKLRKAAALSHVSWSGRAQ